MQDVDKTHSAALLLQDKFAISTALGRNLKPDKFAWRAPSLLQRRPRLPNSVCTGTIGDRDAQNGTSAWLYFWTCIGLNHMALFSSPWLSMTFITRALMAIADSEEH